MVTCKINAFNLEKAKILLSEKGWNEFHFFHLQLLSLLACLKSCYLVWSYLLTTKSRLLTILKKKDLENTGNQHFLLFPQCFLPYQREKSWLLQHLSSANAFKLVTSKILSFEGLKVLLFYCRSQWDSNNGDCCNSCCSCSASIRNNNSDLLHCEQSEA